MPWCPGWFTAAAAAAKAANEPPPSLWCPWCGGEIGEADRALAVEGEGALYLHRRCVDAESFVRRVSAS